MRKVRNNTSLSPHTCPYCHIPVHVLACFVTPALIAHSSLLCHISALDATFVSPLHIFHALSHTSRHCKFLPALSLTCPHCTFLPALSLPALIAHPSLLCHSPALIAHYFSLCHLPATIAIFPPSFSKTCHHCHIIALFATNPTAHYCPLCHKPNFTLLPFFTYLP